MISEDRLAKQTRAAFHGRKDGKDLIPPADATALSDAENEIVGLAQREVDDLESVYMDKLAAAASADPGASDSADAAFQGILADSLGQIRGALALHRDELKALRLEERRLYRQYIFFKRDHGLDREPSYSSSVWWVIGVAMLSVLVEAALNAWFFGEASDRGLAGGAVTAALISLANVTLSFGTGWYPLRYVGHGRHLHKLWALPVLILCFIAIAFFDLAVGHYRELLIADPDASAYRVVDAFLASPLGIQQIESWVLVIVGFVISVVSLRNGFVSSDPYPGFAATHAAHREAEAEYRGAKHHIATTMKALSEQGAARVDKELAARKRRLEGFRGEVAALEQQGLNLTNSIKALEEICNRVLRVYRSENEAVRAPSPSPGYFGEPAALRKSVDWPGLQGLRAAAERAQAQLARLEEAAARARKAMDDRLDEETGKLDSLNQGVDGEVREIIKEEDAILGKKA